jgi:type II secretory pathway pseudopilin PulG
MKEIKVRSILDKSNERAAFTIIELLTVMSIIILLIGLLVPALNMVKRFTKRVVQKNQFHTIEVAMDIYNAEWEEYPPSDDKDEVPLPYCGAMKLAEAMVGQDLAGFNPASKFRSDGTLSGPGTELYGAGAPADKSARRLYLKPENANAQKLDHLYPQGTHGNFERENRVLCDVYPQITHRDTGRLVGMPILYYRADTSKTVHNIDSPDDPANIYRYENNFDFVKLEVPWDPQAGPHPLGQTSDTPTGPTIFYEKTLNSNITVAGGRPYRADSYILLSAGFDGLYGTDDDVFNFGR